MLAAGTHRLWPTPIGVYRYAHAAAVNPGLVAAFTAIRGERTGDFYASPDDLHRRVTAEGWNHLLQFMVDGVARTAEDANAQAWAGRVQRIEVAIEGMWFQIANHGAAHDVHTHGNCSWSGVYVVQVDPQHVDPQHVDTGPAPGNGATRLYGPHFTTLGGGFADAGNTYLQQSTLDIAPVAGQLVVFPSWLAHQAMAYTGRLDRVIVSFNASIHSPDGDQLFGYAAR